MQPYCCCELALVVQQEGVPGHDVRAAITVANDLAAQVQRAEATGHLQRLTAIGPHTAWVLDPTLLRRSVGIHLLPLHRSMGTPPCHTRYALVAYRR